MDTTGSFLATAAAETPSPTAVRAVSPSCGAAVTVVIGAPSTSLPSARCRRASPAQVAVPQPTPPGAFKVVSYGDAFKASSSRDAGDGDEADEEGVGGVEDSDLDEDEEALDAIAGLWISYMSGSSSKEDNGDHVPRDGRRRQ
jgi:hypothetical protein